MSGTDPSTTNLISPYCPPAVIERVVTSSASSSSDQTFNLPSLGHAYLRSQRQAETFGLKRRHPNLSCAYVRTITRMMVISSPSPPPM